MSNITLHCLGNKGTKKGRTIFFGNNSLYQKLENVCIHKARMQLSNPRPPDKQRRTEGEF